MLIYPPDVTKPTARKRKVTSNYMRLIYPHDITQPATKKRKTSSNLMRLIAKKRKLKSKFSNNRSYFVAMFNNCIH